MRIIFDGAYGIKSFGDDAPLISLVSYFKNKFEKLDAVVVSRNSDENPYARYGIRSIPGIEYDAKADSIGRWFRGFNVDDDRSDLKNLYNELKGSQLLVLGAGNFINDYTIDLVRGPLPRLLIMHLLARMVSVPIYWFGMSAGPINTELGRRYAYLASTLASKITLRDEYSYKLLQRIGISRDMKVVPDVVYAFPVNTLPVKDKFSAYKEAHKNKNGVIAISVRGVSESMGMSYGNFIVAMAELCDRLVSIYGMSVLFIPQCIYDKGEKIEDDRFVASQIIEKTKLKDNMHSVDDDINAEDCISLYKNSKAAICLRLHGNVFAVKNSVPTVGISYNPKVLSFYKFISLDNCCIDLKEFQIYSVINLVSFVQKNKAAFHLAAKKLENDGKAALEAYGELAVSCIYEGVAKDFS